MSRTLLGLVLLCTAQTAFAQDDDNDGVNNDIDNCPTVSNADQLDTDSTGPYGSFGDACLDPSAVLGVGVVLGVGSVIGPNVVVQRQSVIGAGAVLETDVIIGRSSTIGSSSTVRMGATVGYSVTVGNDTEVGASSVVGNLASVADNVTLGSMVVLGRSVTVADNAQIGNSTVVGPDVTIGEGADIGAGIRIRKDVVIGQRAAIGDNARIGRDSIIEAGATVGADANLRTGVTVGTFAIVPPSAQLARNEVVPPGDCSPLLDPDMDGLFGCADPDCFSPRCPETCDDMGDNDADGFIDGLDTDCMVGPEICDNDADDNGDSLIDCEDPLCAAAPTCGELLCDDGLDNDGDLLSDCEDDDCWGQDCHQANGAVSWVLSGSVGTRQVLGTIYNNFSSADPACTAAYLYQTTSATYGAMRAENVNGLVQVRFDDPTGSGEIVETCEWSVTVADAMGSLFSAQNVTRQGFQITSPGNCRLGTDPATQSWFLPQQLRHTGNAPVQWGSPPNSSANPWYVGNAPGYVASFDPSSTGFVTYMKTGLNVSGCVFDRTIQGTVYNTATSISTSPSASYGPGTPIPRTYHAYPN